MPTVHREGPFRFLIWPDDHQPPHVHCYNGDGRCVIELETGNVRRGASLRMPDVAVAQRIVIHNQAKLLAAWRKIHGV